MHRNAPLTVEGRRPLCQCIERDGFTIAQAAKSMNISGQTAAKWWNRFRISGSPASKIDQRAHVIARRGPQHVSRGVWWHCASYALGSARFGTIVGLPHRPFTECSSATAAAVWHGWAARPVALLDWAGVYIAKNMAARRTTATDSGGTVFSPWVGCLIAPTPSKCLPSAVSCSRAETPEAPGIGNLEAFMTEVRNS
jgi:hypothetical protein